MNRRKDEKRGGACCVIIQRIKKRKRIDDQKSSFRNFLFRFMSKQMVTKTIRGEDTCIKVCKEWTDLFKKELYFHSSFQPDYAVDKKWYSWYIFSLLMAAK